MEHPIWFVCLMGMGTVFMGLIILIAAVTLLGAALSRKPAEEGSGAEASSSGAGRASASAEVPGADARGVPADFDKDILAAIAAAVAMEMGEGVDALRILSVKQVEE